MSSSICKKNVTVPKYCDSCDQTYQNAKALSTHKRSAKHKLNEIKVAELRKQETIKNEIKPSIYVMFERLKREIFADLK